MGWQYAVRADFPSSVCLVLASTLIETGDRLFEYIAKPFLSRCEICSVMKARLSKQGSFAPFLCGEYARKEVPLVTLLLLVIFTFFVYVSV